MTCSPQDAQASPGRPLPPPADGDVVDMLLTRIISTGRAYFDTKENSSQKLGAPLKLGMPKDGRVEWVVQEDSRQSPHMVLDETGPGIKILHSSSPWYVDLATGEAGPVKLPFSRGTFAALMAAPRVSASDAPAIHKILEEKAQGLPLPQIDIVEEMRSERPQVKLSLKFEKFKNPRLVSDGKKSWLSTVTTRPLWFLTMALIQANLLTRGIATVGRTADVLSSVKETLILKNRSKTNLSLVRLRLLNQPSKPSCRQLNRVGQLAIMVKIFGSDLCKKWCLL